MAFANCENSDQAHIAVIIVNYRTAYSVLESITRLAAIKLLWPNLRIFIVDNFSSDGSDQIIGNFLVNKELDNWITLIINPENRGFAAGNNVGIRVARAQDSWTPEFFFFLNPDAYIETDTITHLLAFSRRHAGAILGALLTDKMGVPRASSFNFPGALSEFQRGAAIGAITRLRPSSQIGLPIPELPQVADWVSGAAFWLPAPLLEKLGEMDEGYFLYFEEVDYMLQAKKAGCKVWLIPSARVVHMAGMSTGIVGGKSVGTHRMPVYWYRSWHRFFFKNFGITRAWFSGSLWIIGLLLNRMLACFMHHRRRTDGHLIIDFLKYALLGR